MAVILTDNEYADASGKNYDRVTSICKLAYVDDPFQFVKPTDLDKASARGSAIHRLTSDEAEAGDEEWQDWAEGWDNFKQDTGYVEIASELTIWSETYGTAGTLDSFGILNNKTDVVEKKATAGIPLTVGLQTSGYKGMLTEMVERGYFGHIFKGKDPEGWATFAVTDTSPATVYDKMRDSTGGYFAPRGDRESVTQMLKRQLSPRGRRLVWLRPNFPRGYKLISEGDLMLINGKRVPILSPTDWQTFIGLLMVKRWRERYLKPTTTKEKSDAGESTDITWR